MIDVSHKYARAFLNVYHGTLTSEMIDAIQQMCEFLRAHHRVVFFLKLSVLDEEIKIRGLHMLCDRYGLGESVRALIALLQQHRRLYLITDVLCHVRDAFLVDQNIESFCVTCASELTDEQEKTIHTFLSAQLSREVICCFTVDRSLIAGVRAQGANYMWERSVAQQLRNVRQLAGV